jgi:archaellum component FlaC
MSFDKAEARLKTIKKLQAQLKHLSQEICDLRCKYDAERLARAPRLWDELKEENKELKEELEDVKEEYWEKGWNTGKCDTWDEIDKTVKPLKEENKKLKEGLEEMTQDEIMYSHEWLEWKEYIEKCQRFIYRRNQQTNTKC